MFPSPSPWCARDWFTRSLRSFATSLYGLVVSDHRSDSISDISHQRWQDYLNTKDLCVIWGKNIETGVFRRMKFSSQNFTCWYRYPDEETARLFSEDCLSNNHLLCADDRMAKIIRSVSKGDQIHFRGYLATYEQKANGFFRGTSTTRSDRGNGACETVFLTGFRIIKNNNPFWRAIFTASKILLIPSLILMLAV